MTYLARRTGSINWYYRETTPSDVRDLLLRRGERAPREVWVSLSTPDRGVASGRLAKARADQHRKWETVRASGTPASHLPSPSEMGEAVAEFVHDRFIEVHRRSLAEKLALGLDPTSEAQRRRAKIAQVELLPSAEDHAEMERLAAVLCRKKQWHVGPAEGGEADRWAELVRLVTSAVQHGRSTVVQTLEGRPVATSRDVVMDRIGVRRVAAAKEGETLLELFDLYSGEAARNGKSRDTLAADRRVIQHFASFVGRDRAVTDIGRPEVREFKRVLSRVPHRWTTNEKLKGLPIAEAAARWEKMGGEGRSLRTVSRELSAISSLFVWMIDNAYVEDNPTRGFFPKIDKTRTKYPPYTQAQLEAVFRSPLFSRCHKTKEHLAGDREVRDWRYWLPLCALYSGARAGEIAQLLCTDLRHEDDVWVFDFNEDEGETAKSLKTAASRRLVPVHPVLIDLGLIEHMDRSRRHGHVRLFDIEPGPRGDMSYRPSRFWQRYLTRIGVKEPGLALHSFRHTFADECRRKGVDKDVLKALLGHADTSITGHYGTLGTGNLEQRRAAICALSFGDIHRVLQPKTAPVTPVESINHG